MTDHPVIVDEHHVYCQETGFCTSCGVHRHMAEREYIACAHGDNVVAMSHRRFAEMQAQRARNRVD